MRILFVEDEEDMRRETSALIVRSFPKAVLDLARDGREARDSIDKASRCGIRIDIAVLDLKIPARGARIAEFDFGLCEYVRKAFPNAVTIHYTGYGDRPEVNEHRRLFGYDKIVDKIKDGPRTLVETMRQGYGDMLRNRTQFLLGGAARGLGPLSLAPRAGMHCGTFEVNSLLQDVSQDFGMLDRASREDIQRFLSVEEVAGTYRVSLMPARM